VAVLYGTWLGLTTVDNQLWTLESASVEGDAQSHSGLSGISGGDVTGDGYAELAFGFADYDVSAELRDAGAILVLVGSPLGLGTVGNRLWTQDAVQIDHPGAQRNHFGSALARADVDADVCADVFVGLPGESSAGGRNAGAVAVLYGTPAGISTFGNQEWTQDSFGVLDAAEPDDAFGEALPQR
jgi:hypothetical protein